MSETTTEPTAKPTVPDQPTAEPQGDPADKPLGEKGEKALKAERERANDLEKQLRTATSKLTEIERANETAMEKAQREAQEAKAEVEKIPATVTAQLRDHLVRIHNISDDDRDLFLTATDPETLLKQVGRLVERTPTTPKPDPSQGGKGETPALNSNGLEQALRSKLGIV